MTEKEIYQMFIDKMIEIDPNINLDPSTFDGRMAEWLAETVSKRTARPGA